MSANGNGHQVACDEVQEQFLRLEEGRLSPEHERVLRAHLSGCEVCRVKWAAWQVEGRLLGEALRPVSIPRDVAGDVAARLRRQAPRPASRRRRLVLRWALTAAAAGLLLVLGRVLLLSPGHVQLGYFGVLAGRPLVAQRGARFVSVVEDGAEAYDGALLVTGEGERLVVRLADGSRLVLSEATEVRLSGGAAAAECGHLVPHVCLRRGEVLCTMSSMKYFRAVGTPLGTALLPAKEFSIRYEPGAWTRLEALAGAVRFSCPYGVAEVRVGEVWVVEAGDGVPRRLRGPGED